MDDPMIKGLVQLRRFVCQHTLTHMDPGAAQNRRYRIHLAQAYQSHGSILAGLDRHAEAKSALQEAEQQLHLFAETWDESYPVISKSWRGNWSRVVPMFGYPSEIRRVI